MFQRIQLMCGLAAVTPRTVFGMRLDIHEEKNPDHIQGLRENLEELSQKISDGVVIGHQESKDSFYVKLLADTITAHGFNNDPTVLYEQQEIDEYLSLSRNGFLGHIEPILEKWMVRALKQDIALRFDEDYLCKELRQTLHYGMTAGGKVEFEQAQPKKRQESSFERLMAAALKTFVDFLRNPNEKFDKLFYQNLAEYEVIHESPAPYEWSWKPSNFLDNFKNRYDLKPLKCVNDYFVALVKTVSKVDRILSIAPHRLSGVHFENKHNAREYWDQKCTAGARAGELSRRGLYLELINGQLYVHRTPDALVNPGNYPNIDQDQRRYKQQFNAL